MPLLERSQLVDAMAALAVGVTTGASTLLDKLLGDMHEVFGYPITEDVHRAILAAMLTKPRTLQPAFMWLRTMQQKPGHVPPSLELWHDYLRGAVTYRSPGTLRRSVRDMVTTGCKPTNTTYQIVIHGLFQDEAPTLTLSTELLDEMKVAGLPHDSDTLEVFCEAFRRLGMTEEEGHIRAAYERRFTRAPKQPSGKSEEDKLHDALAQCSAEQGILAAVSMYREMWSARRTHPTPAALNAILRFSHKYADLRTVETKLGVDADFDVWLTLIKNAVVKGDREAAVNLYNRARRSGIQHNPQMAEYVIHSLCFNATSLRGPSATDIDHALALYRALCNTADQDIQTSGPTASIYKSLLRAMATSQHAKRYIPVVVQLMEEMSARGFTSESVLLQHAIVALMRAAPTHEEAFAAYERMHAEHARDTRALVATGYLKILDAFCKLQTPTRTLPAPTQYFQIVRDMREAGHEITAAVYTILLGHLAFVATHASGAAADPEARDRLLATIRRTHDHLTLDASITPDTALWNQLMDTYQRAGSPSDALRVWEMMYLQGKIDEISVSIVLDACSFAGAYDLMIEIWTKLREQHFPLNQRNWRNWVEGLCRVGRLGQATRVVCEEMGQGNGPDTMPDVDVVRLLLKFAKTYDKAPEVRDQIKTSLPELWDTLPADLRSL